MASRGQRVLEGDGLFRDRGGQGGKELASIEKATLTPATKERRLASTRKRLESAEDLRGQSTVNAARTFVRAWMPAVRWLSGGLPGAKSHLLKGPDIMRRD